MISGILNFSIKCSLNCISYIGGQRFTNCIYGTNLIGCVAQTLFTSDDTGTGVFGTITANNTPLTKVKNGGYYPYISSPGSTHFVISTEADNEADVTVEVGKEKYLKTTIGMGFLVGHLHISEVSPEIGRKEIEECNLLEPFEP